MELSPCHEDPEEGEGVHYMEKASLCLWVVLYGAFTPVLFSCPFSGVMSRKSVFSTWWVTSLPPSPPKSELQWVCHLAMLMVGGLLSCAIKETVFCYHLCLCCPFLSRLPLGWIYTGQAASLSLPCSLNLLAWIGFFPLGSLCFYLSCFSLWL